MLDMRTGSPEDASIGDLFHRLVDDGRAYASAEIGLYKEVARYRFGKAKVGLVAFVVAGVLGLGGLIAFLVSLVMGLDPLIGPVAGGLVVLAGTGLVAFLLARFGAGKMGALSGDPEEKAALVAGETRP